MLARNAGICCLGEAFGMALVIPFPTEQKHQRERDEAISVGMRNEYERREHHCKVPIVDSAIGAAAVFHKPRLEGAEKEDANHIANAVGKSDQDQNSCIYNIGKIKRADRAVKRKPSRNNGKGALPRLKARLFGFGRDEIACKLLLASGTFKLRGKESASHFNGVNYPYHNEK